MHFDENTLFEYGVSKEDLPEDVSLHLRTCAYCKERYEYYVSFEREVNVRFTNISNGDELAEKLSAKPNRKLLPEKDFRIVKVSGSSVGIIPAVRNTIQKFFYNYPHFSRFSFASFVLASMIILFNSLSGVKKEVVYVEAANGFLVAYDNSGEKVWAKFISDGFGEINSKFSLIYQNPLEMTDVDGDGTKEIFLCLAHTPSSYEEREYIYCYNNDGSIRWKTFFKPDWQFASDKIPNIYTSPTLITRKSSEGNRVLAYAVFNNLNYYPSALTEIDAQNGNILRAYYHPGAIAGAFYTSNYDSLPCLFVFGENNSYDRAFLSVLNPDDISGAGPGDSLRIPLGISPNKHYKYILFPALLPKTITTTKRDVVANIKIDGDSLIIATLAFRVDENYYSFLFHLNREFQCTAVDVDDRLLIEMDRRKSAGKPYVEITDSYLDSLKNGLTYFK